MKQQYIPHNMLVISLLIFIPSLVLGAEEQSHQKKNSASAEKSRSLTMATVIALTAELSPNQSDHSLGNSSGGSSAGFESHPSRLTLQPSSDRPSSTGDGRSLTEGAVVALTTESSPNQSADSSGNSSGTLERHQSMIVLSRDSATSSTIAYLLPAVLTASVLRENFESLGLLTSQRRSQQEQQHSFCEKICGWFRSWCQHPEPVISDRELHEKVERLTTAVPDNTTLKKLEISLIFRHLLASQEASKTSTKIGLAALCVSIISGAAGIYGATNS